jgi:hypothetical protein
LNGFLKFAAPIAALLAVAACNAGGSSSVPAASGQTASQSKYVPEWKASGRDTQVCPDVPRGRVQCDVLLRNKQIGGGLQGPAIGGWQPLDFQTRYKLPSSTDGAGQVVAIVDAYDNPDAAADIAEYRTEFGLGTANFTKYNQTGQTSNYPTGNKGWGLEEDLDIEMVSASCPKCTIYLVEANSDYTSDLEAAEIEAVKLGAHIVSNSWGCTGSNDCLDTADFSTKGVEYLASAGDGAYGTQAPAALASVVAVGGTVLSKSGSPPTYSETVWVDSGAGCASGITKPSWQHDPKCIYRTMNDVSAVAENAAEYDTYEYGGWITVDGTSIASPLTAGVFGLAGNASSLNAGEKFWELKKKKAKKELHYIDSGSVARCPSSLQGTYLCEAGTKEYKTYSAPSGWGTPDGIKAY